MPERPFLLAEETSKSQTNVIYFVHLCSQTIPNGLPASFHCFPSGCAASGSRVFKWNCSTNHIPAFTIASGGPQTVAPTNQMLSRRYQGPLASAFPAIYLEDGWRDERLASQSGLARASICSELHQ